MYKIIADPIAKKAIGVLRSDGWSIPFDPANTDYQTFKAQINADEAQLQDADGNTMSAEDAKQFMANLP